MSYVGGKHYTRKPIVQLIQRECVALGVREVWEPFCGGLHITAELGRKWISVHASDYSAPAVTLYKAMRYGFTPSPIRLTREQWGELKQAHRRGEIHPMISFAGFCGSMNGIYFTAYVPDENVVRGKLHALQQRVRASRFTSLAHSSYASVKPPPHSVIYCDPPYADTDTSAYRSLPLGQRRFDSAAFWDWCRARATEGSTVLVSEYAAPEDVPCIWAKEVAVRTKQHTGESARSVERVFCLKGKP